MATKACVHRRVQSYSSPKKKQQTVSVSTNNDRDPPSISMQEKPMPNYLRPTLSSCGSTTCNYPSTQHHHSDSHQPSAITKKPIRLSSFPSFQFRDVSSPHKDNNNSLPLPLPKQKQSISPHKDNNNSLASPKQMQSISPHKHKNNSSPKQKQSINTPQKDSNSSSTKLKQSISPKQSPTNSPRKSVKIGERRGLQQLPNATKKRSPKEKVISVDNSISFPRLRTTNREKQEMIERMLREEVKLREVKDLSNKSHKNISDNEVIEEEARKLADRRNKVKALVGAFETVISLHEPEAQQTPERGEHGSASPFRGQQENGQGQQSQQLEDASQPVDQREQVNDIQISQPPVTEPEEEQGEELDEESVAKEEVKEGRGGDEEEEEKVDDGEESQPDMEVDEVLTDHEGMENVKDMVEELTESTEEGRNNTISAAGEDPIERIIGVVEEDEVNPNPKESE